MLVSVDGWDEFRCWASVASNQRELALDELRVGDVAESLALDQDFSATLHRSVMRGHAQKHWLDVVAKEESCVNPIDAVKRNVYRLLLHDVVIRRCLANDAHSRDELPTNDFLADLAVRHHAEFELLIEPSA